MIKTKAYNTWMYLLRYRMDWVSVMDMASEVDLTVRQVMSLLSGMDSDYLEKKRVDGEMFVRLVLTEDEADRLTRMKTAEKCGITEDHMAIVWNALSPAGWMTLADVTEDTPFNRNKVAKILSIMDGVDVKTVGDRKYYVRALDF